MDQDLLPEGMTFRRWAATSANTRRRKSTGPKRSVALGRQLPGAENMKPGTASSTYSRRLRWSQLTSKVAPPQKERRLPRLLLVSPKSALVPQLSELRADGRQSLPDPLRPHTSVRRAGL